MLNLDPWQQEFLAFEGNKIACAGRQVGKSEITGIDGGEWAAKHPKTTTLMIAPTERQAYELFDKTFAYLDTNYRHLIRKGKHRPTRHEIKLINGARILCLPTGLAGTGIRGFTVHRLYAEEAARIPREVFQAVTPMLVTTGGKIILISSAFISDGYFFEVWTNFNNAFDDFKRWTVNSEEVFAKREICSTWTEQQKADSINYLASEKARMTRTEYGQEYLCQFSGKNSRYFSEELISKAMVLQRYVASPAHIPSPLQDAYLGIDVARMGKDETVLLSVQRIDKREIRQVDMEITTKTLLTETIDRIKRANKKYDYRKIYLDSAGLGSGVFDILLQDEETRRKIVSLENARRSLDREKTRFTKLDKEVMYANLRRLMEANLVKLFNDPEIAYSLRSIQFEVTDSGDTKIFGNYTHIAEALVRAAWCVQEKALELWVR